MDEVNTHLLSPEPEMSGTRKWADLSCPTVSRSQTQSAARAGLRQRDRGEAPNPAGLPASRPVCHPSPLPQGLLAFTPSALALKASHPRGGSTRCLRQSPTSCWTRGWGTAWRASPSLQSGGTWGQGERLLLLHLHLLSHSLGVSPHEIHMNVMSMLRKSHIHCASDTFLGHSKTILSDSAPLSTLQTL